MDASSGRFGQLVKEHRRSQGFSLRSFCNANGFDPGNFSKIERGIFSPPSPAKIKEYARALGLTEGSDDYTELVDAAAIDRGELPAEFLQDEQLVRELPALFRTLRGQRVSEDRIDSLIQLIRSRG